MDTFDGNGKDTMMLVGGGKTQKLKNSVKLHEASANEVIVVEVPMENHDNEKVQNDYINFGPTYKPYLHQLDGNIILVDGGVVRVHLIGGAIVYSKNCIVPFTRSSSHQNNIARILWWEDGLAQVALQ